MDAAPTLTSSTSDWQWVYAVWAVLALVGLLLVGLAVEGLAGLAERAITRKSGRLRPWYIKATNPPADWGNGQLWIWRSPQAADEFARRRLRILVCRNTWFLLASLTAFGLTGLVWQRGPDWCLRALILAIGGTASSALFL